jgi:hypothetical protein
MHDCGNTKEQLIDLVFNELDQEARRRVLLEIENCHDCLAQYRSMTETLQMFDQTAETMLPDESYWPDYEAGLRIRLQQVRPSFKRRLADWLGGFGAFTARPLQLAGALALVFLAIGCWWIWLRQQEVAPAPTLHGGIQAPTRQPLIEPPDKKIAVTTKPAEITAQRRTDRPKSAKQDRRLPSIPQGERREMRVRNNVESMASAQPMVASSLFTPQTISHFEKAQLLLRSFRNARSTNGPATIDLAYEKQLSQRLLYQNILLRREAESKGILPMEEALGDLEPFLLDIANLPDAPSPSELSNIKERLQRKEMIAALHIYTAPSSLPSYPNQ